jgi:hypothetical protein
MRNLKHELNESQSLAILIYSHFIFWIMRLISFVWLEKSDFAAAVSGIYSLVLGIDSIASICIYFLPKLYLKEESGRPSAVFDTPRTRSMLPSSAPPEISYEPHDDTYEERMTLPSSAPPETSYGTHDDTNEERTVQSSYPLHGANAVRYEGNCPHCGKGIEQDVLLTELESFDEMAPLNDAKQSSHDEDCNEEADPVKLA